MDANTMLSLVVGLVVVIFICSMVSKVLKEGGCGGLVFALIILGMIALGAAHFAHLI